ncbi:MAG: TraR/DksA C4-type zinc finger protein [Vicinamibacteria bacterium]|nr:TraR/DksA C4-type zinc finger protein [Vicinamibacteria bacterium]
MATLANKRNAERTRHQALEQLLHLEETVLRLRRQMLRDNPAAEVTDLEERSQEAVQESVGLSLAELASRTLRGIEEALQRFDAGEFGTCSQCGGPIGSARLRALPFATQCRPCREVEDRVVHHDGLRREAQWPARDAGLETLGE